MINLKRYNKIRWSAALVLFISLFMSSCQKDNINGGVNNNAITFTVRVADNSQNIESRAALTYYNNGDNANNFTEFGVYGYELNSATDPATIGGITLNNEKLELDAKTGNWNYAEPKYSTSGGKMSFIAVAPYEKVNKGLNVTEPAVGGGNELVIDYTVPLNIANQPDLMVATVAPTNEVGNGVELTFNHMLSAVTFSVKGQSTAKITAISVENVNGKATLTANANANDNSCTWSEPSISSDFTATLNANTTPTDATTTQRVADDYLLMVPQEHGISSQIKVTIAATDDSWSIEKYIPLDGTEWVMGKIYDYEIELDGKNFDFNLYVKEWKEGDENNCIFNDGVNAGVTPSNWILFDEINNESELSSKVSDLLDEKIYDLVLVGDYNFDNVNNHIGCYEVYDYDYDRYYYGINSKMKSIDLRYLRNFNIITKYTFYNNSYLQNILLPDSVTEVESRAFENCSSLTSINLPNATTIAESAFENCSSLTSINLPNATTIGSYAFSSSTSYGSSLTSANLPKATTIEMGTFNNCNKLSYINLPSATKISRYALYSLKEGVDIYLTSKEDIEMTYNFYDESTDPDDYTSYNLYLDEDKVLKLDDNDEGVTFKIFSYSFYFNKPESTNPIIYNGNFKSVNFIDENGVIKYTLEKVDDGSGNITYQKVAVQ